MVKILFDKFRITKMTRLICTHGHACCTHFACVQICANKACRCEYLEHYTHADACDVPCSARKKKIARLICTHAARMRTCAARIISHVQIKHANASIWNITRMQVCATACSKAIYSAHMRMCAAVCGCVQQCADVCSKAIAHACKNSCVREPYRCKIQPKCKLASYWQAWR